MPPADAALSRALVRHLLRAARRLDADPVAKALLVSRPRVLYNRRTDAIERVARRAADTISPTARISVWNLLEHWDCSVGPKWLRASRECEAEVRGRRARV